MISQELEKLWPNALVLVMVFFLLPAVIYAQTISLGDAVQKALQKNPRLNAMQKQEEVANYQVWEAKSGHLPRLSVSGAYTLYEEPNIIVPIHQQGVFPPLDDRIFESSAQLTVPIFSSGRTQASIRAAKASRKWTGARQQILQTDILMNVAGIFLSSAELKDNEELIEARLEVLYQRLKEMDALTKEGRISTADHALILSAIETTIGDSLNIAGKWHELGWRLGQILGMQQLVYPDIEGLDAQALNNSQIPETDMNFLFEANGFIMQAKAQVEQAEAMESLNKRTFLPDLNGFAAYNYRSGGTDWDPVGEWAAGLRLSIPIFEGGRRIAKWQAAKAALKSAEQSMKAAVQEENARLKIASSQWRSAESQRQSLTKATMHKKQFVTAQQAVYQAGRLPLSELMSQEAELLQLHLQEKSQAYTVLRTAIEYYATAGKLTEETIYTILGSTK